MSSKGAPRLDARFIHSSSSIATSDLFLTLPADEKKDEASSSSKSASWRSFTDSENAALEKVWQTISEEERNRIEDGAAGAAKAKEVKAAAEAEQKRREGKDPESKEEEEEGVIKGKEEKSAEGEPRGVESEIVDPEAPQPEHVVPVGIDRLFSVDLRSLNLYPVFWNGSSVQVYRATWFYPTPVSSVASLSSCKFHPVPLAVARQIEVAYSAIQPWQSSYTSKLQSARDDSEEAVAALKQELEPAGGQVLFEGPKTARVFARSKGTLWGLFRTPPGRASPGGTAAPEGSIALRGFEACREYFREEAVRLREEQARADEVRKKVLRESKKKKDDKASEETTDSADGPESRNETADALEQGQEAKEEMEPETAGDEQGDKASETETEVDELVLVIHGIGQKLASRWDALSIVHAVNALRAECSKQASGAEMSTVAKGRRLQFIPVRWRTNLDFETLAGDHEDAAIQPRNKFGLDDIMVKDSVTLVRNIISGLALDIPMYLSQHREKMTHAVIRDANRVYRLFCARNPYFAAKGKVSIIAHSLGSALATDILSHQPTIVPPLKDMTPQQRATEKSLVFNTRIAFFAGSPAALIMYINQAQLIARRGRGSTSSASSQAALDSESTYGCLAVDAIYNIYHQVDPVACTLNATVDSRYAKILTPVPVSKKAATLLYSISESVGGSLSKLMRDRGYNVPNWLNASSWVKQEETEKEQQPSVLEMEKEKAEKDKGRGLSGEEKEAGFTDLEEVLLAEERFKALNPLGCIDFYLPSEGYIEYVDMIPAHASYWTDSRFAKFVLTELFATEEHHARARLVLAAQRAKEKEKATALANVAATAAVEKVKQVAT